MNLFNTPQAVGQSEITFEDGPLPTLAERVERQVEAAVSLQLLRTHVATDKAEVCREAARLSFSEKLPVIVYHAGSKGWQLLRPSGLFEATEMMKVGGRTCYYNGEKTIAFTGLGYVEPPGGYWGYLGS